MLRSSHKDDFLERTKAAREERQMEKIRGESAVKIQCCVRGWLAKLRTRAEVNSRLDIVFPAAEDSSALLVSPSPSLEMYKTAKYFLIFNNPMKERERLERVLKYIVASLDLESPKASYIGVFLLKEHSVAWIAHMKQLAALAAKLMADAAADAPSYTKKIPFYILVLVSLTASSTWRVVRSKALAPLAPHINQICVSVVGHLIDLGLMGQLKAVLLTGLASSKPLLKKTTLAAIISLSLRPLTYANNSAKVLSLFILNILSVPSLIYQVRMLCPESLAPLQKEQLLKQTVHLLSQMQQLKIHFNALEGSYALCLTANLIHLLHLETTESLGEDVVDVVSVLTRLLESCAQYVTAKQSNLSHWHPVLGWFSVSLDRHLQATISHVKYQLARLWHPDTIRLLTAYLQAVTSHLPRPTPPPPPEPQPSNAAKRLMRRAISHTKTTYAATTQSITPPINRLGNVDSMRIALVCSLYQAAIRTLSQLRLEILTGLSCGDLLLKPLWLFLNSLGPTCGLKAFTELLACSRGASAPEFQMLILFCDTFSHLVTILDDSEFYESEEPFAQHEYALVGSFVNQLLYRAIVNGALVEADVPLFGSLSNLLAVLRRRDERRSFCPPGNWLVREARLTDLEKGRQSAALLVQKMPHIISHKERVSLFRKKVQREKAMMGILDNETSSSSPASTLITVHRSRIVEDGYRQLANLSSQGMKGIIRVKFVNLQGLDEAGIDQDGVFKEFLEETIKRVFDPGLNLFCITSEERLYPSPMSHLTENHLELLEFVGRMIGKAVYEGIVVDVPFASFFLTQVLGHDHSNLYSYFDEMASSDPELYKNLTYVKHYQGDVEDLGLTFSFDQDLLGSIVSHELVPGGKSINVTNENRISYIHTMAHFKMHKQIQKQVAAFRRGFQTVVPLDWLSLFSGPEVQRLISGDNTPIDLKDLRKNTSYYGGFHDSHRVIVWLWEILDKDFDDKEKSMFLKFVTSCSKPPLLGFEHLEPPFSIRCVEVSDEEDDGDTVGSVLRGFLALNKKDPVNRLPTASTCFNLLKLPNYQKKTTLRDKLRYAISCNTGFELS